MPGSNRDARRIALLVALLGVLAALVIWRVRPAITGVVRGSTAELPRTGNFAVPALTWAGASERTVPTPGSGRNLFTYGPPPTPTPDTRPTPTPLPTLPPRPMPTPTRAGVESGGKWLPPPPRFTLAYRGWLGPDRLQVAIFSEGDDVLAIPVGDTIHDKFIVRQVGPADVTIGFVGYPDEITTKVPIAR
jgi:hypothetical protein